MPTIDVLSPAPAECAPPPPPLTATPLAAARAFGVMLGGPLLLLGAISAAGGQTLRALAGGRLPRPAAAATLGAAAAYARWGRPWMRRWGATRTELEMALPGDDTVARPGIVHTHAMPIDAPAHAVWPWIAQIGQDRGGFYSYTSLENLAGCRMHNADAIHPEWQHRAPGETVLLHPASGLRVLRFEPGRTLVLEGGWSLHVTSAGPGRSRVVARFRAPGGLAGTAYALLLELPHFLMERRMLLEIRRRAERRR